MNWSSSFIDWAKSGFHVAIWMLSEMLGHSTDAITLDV
jgi:hypothetical protein